ncbi:hypothetical protein AB0B27_13430 [Micromonospora rifamycinica]|uniref:LppU/SCO3897 family protein n=1 Tax=Micromonospora rifamycinica TaxID=291594 RepID=UPI0033C869D2
MTSEGQHRPGQEPDEVPPGSGGPASYGDRQPQQDPGYGTPATPDLGWAPPPPTGRAEPAGQSWTPPAQPAAWGGQQAPRQSEPTEAWTPPAGATSPAWAGQPGQPAWATAPAPAAGNPDSSPQPGWSQSEEPGWTPAEQTAPAWAQPEPGARGAARVPQPDSPAGGGWSAPPDAAPAAPAAWPAQGSAPHDTTPGATGWGTAPAPAPDEPRAGGWAADDRADTARGNGWSADDRAGATPTRDGWPGGPQDAPGNSGGWATGTASHPDEAPRPAGRASVPVPAQPEPANQAAPWPQPESGGHGGTQVPPADTPAGEGWSTGGDPARAGGWPANRPGPDDAGRSGDWPNGSPNDRAPQWAPDEPATARWEGRREQPALDSWPAATPHDEQPRHDDPAPGQEWPTPQAGSRGAAAVSSREDRPESGAAWPAPELPARAATSVAAPDGPPAWAGAAGDPQPPHRAGADRPVVPDAEPWGPGQAWGRAEPAGQPAEGGWEPRRGDDQPIYQPGPAPGISPANAVPLPPQEQRVPGASLAAAPPADYVPPAQHGGPVEQPHGREAAGWGEQQPPSTAGPVLPAQRVAPESEGAGRASVPAADGGDSGAVGRASASASVPTASRVAPPADQGVRPGGPVVPQPRVYGRPARPEPADEAEEHDAPRPDHDSRFDEQDRPRFDGPGQQRFDGPEHPAFDGPERSRFDDQDRAHGFGGEAPSSAPPAFGGGIPAFADPAGSNRPMNGTRPHGPADRPAEPFGSRPTSGGPTSGAPAGAAPVPGYGHPAHDPAHGGYASPFPPAGQQFPPTGQQFGPAGQQPGTASWPVESDSEHGRFDAFKPEAEPEQKAEQPTPKVRNGRVLALVLIVAVLILAVPLGLLMLLGKIGADDEPAPFNPAVGSCVKQSGTGASAAGCSEPGAFTVVSKVDAKEKCTDPAQPHVVLQGGGVDRVLCLKPAGQ